MTEPIKNILIREVEDKNIEKLLNKFSEEIEELVNFGTQLLQWELNEAKGGEEILPIGLMFRNILELLDSISILIREGSIDPCKAMLRTILETVFGLEYILEKNTKNRALAFLVCHYHKQLKMLSKLNPTEQSNRQLRQKLRVDKSTSIEDDLFTLDDIEERIENVNNILKDPIYADAEAEYQKAYNNGNRNPKWYSLYSGVNNLEQLAIYLNRPGLYEIIYRSLSESVHGSDILQGKVGIMKSGNLGIVQLRFLKDAQEVTINAHNLGMLTYQIMTDNRLKNHKGDYAKWYLTVRDYKLKLITKKMMNLIEHPIE